MTVQQVRTQFITDYSNKGVQAFQRDLNTLGGRVDKVSNQASQSFGRFARFSQAAGTALMVGVGAALAVGIKASIDFEDAFAGVRKTVDASEPAFQRLARQIRDMATEIPIAATELAKIGELGGQLGIPVEALETFIETIAKLGVATNLSTEDAATGIARLGNVMGTSHKDYENLASSLVDLGNNFATTESEILSFGTRLAGIGSTIGLTEGEVLGLSAAFTALGEPAERGATAVQRAFVSMFQAVSQGGEDLETFAKVAGMAADEFATLFGEDPAQAFVAFARGLNDVVAAGEDVTSILQSVGLGSQRTLGAMLKAAQGADQIEDAMNRGNRAFAENVALSDEAAERFGTMQSQITLLKNSFTELRMEIGDRATPAFKDLLGFMGSWFRLIGDNIGLLEKLFAVIALFIGAKGLLAFSRLIAGSAVALGELSVKMTGLGVAGLNAQAGLAKAGSALRLAGGWIAIAVMALGALSVAFGRNRQHAEDYAAAVRNTVDVLEDFADGTALAGDVYDAFVTQLGQKTGIFDITLELDEYQDFARRFGTTTRELVDLAINDFEEFERRTSQITSQLSASLPELDEGMIGRDYRPSPGDQQRLEDLNTWRRIVEEITVATASLRAEEEARRHDMDLAGRARATAPGGPGAIGMGGPTAEFMEGIGSKAADIAAGLLTTREEFNEALEGMLADTRDFTVDFSDEWDDIVADFNSSLFDWGTAWNGYERVTAISTAEMTKSIDNFIADQRARTAALAFVYDEFGEEVGQMFSTLPLDLQMGLAATLEQFGPERFRTQMDSIMGGWAEMSMLAVENAMTMAPTGARTAFEAWVDVFDELMGELPEHATEGSQLWMDAVIDGFGEFRVGLMEQQPMLTSAFDDFVEAALEQVEKDHPVPIDIEQMTRGMTTPERLQFFTNMGLDWVTAVMLAWGTLPDKMGAVAGNAAKRVDKNFGGGIRAESPSKLFMEYGKFAAQGFEMGFNANLDSMNFKPSQPVFKLEAPASQAANGPSITIVNPEHKDDDILDGLKRASTLVGLTRAAETTPGFG